MYLLDTNICIAILNGNENVVKNFRSKYRLSRTCGDKQNLSFIGNRE